MTLTITRLDLSAADLRDAAAGTRDAKAARRMLAIGLVLEGWSRESAAEACAMDRQTLCDWVHRYNELGLAGLFDRPRRNGPQPRLSAEQQAQVAEWARFSSRPAITAVYSMPDLVGNNPPLCWMYCISRINENVAMR